MSLRGVSVKVNDQNSAKVNVSYGNSISVKVNNQQDYKVKNVGLATPGANFLRDLKDVSALSPVNKDTILFNALTGKYEARQIESDDLNLTNIDAGTF